MTMAALSQAIPWVHMIAAEGAPAVATASASDAPIQAKREVPRSGGAVSSRRGVNDKAIERTAMTPS
jgi:hypothetical protein